jgi:hypothetical protein
MLGLSQYWKRWEEGGEGGGAVGSLPAWPVPGSTCLRLSPPTVFLSALSVFLSLVPSPPFSRGPLPEYEEKRVIYTRLAHWPESRLNCLAIGGVESVF